MDIIQTIIRETPLPKMTRVRQTFPRPILEDIPGTLRQQISSSVIAAKIKSGMRIAIAVGSRGVAQLPLITRTIAEELKARGAIPFIVPGMGSHGAAIATAQTEILARLGVTEESIGCPICSSMEVVELGRLENGPPVLMDKYAYAADGIVVVNRIKPHSAFQGPCESGLVKMLAIGLGKQKGAAACHSYGFKYMASFIVEIAKMKIAKCPVLFGVASIENAYDEVMKVAVIPAEDLIATEEILLQEAKANMPRILFDPLDVLIVRQIGKEISGDGMDPNITGRWPTDFAVGGADINKVVVLDLTEKSHGNAIGIGLADYTTRRLYNKIDFTTMYANALTATVTSNIKLPMIFDCEKDAVLAAIRTCNAPDLRKARIVYMLDTLHLEDIYVSDELLSEVEVNPQATAIGQAKDLLFNTQKDLVAPHW